MEGYFHAAPTSAPGTSNPHHLPLRPQPGCHLGTAGPDPRAAGPTGPGPGHLRRTLGLRRDRPGPDPAPAAGVLASLGRTRLRAHGLPDIREVQGPGRPDTSRAAHLAFGYRQAFDEARREPAPPLPVPPGRHRRHAHGRPARRPDHNPGSPGRPATRRPPGRPAAAPPTP